MWSLTTWKQLLHRISNWLTPLSSLVFLAHNPDTSIDSTSQAYKQAELPWAEHITRKSNQWVRDCAHA